MNKIKDPKNIKNIKNIKNNGLRISTILNKWSNKINQVAKFSKFVILLALILMIDV